MFTAFQKAKAKKGFTLVELIVVISIIAILMLILVPSLLAYLKNAKQTKAEANAKTCYNALVAVFTDEYAKGTTITESAIMAEASSNGMLSGIDGVASVKLDSSGNILYAEWAVDSSALTSADSSDGKYAKWPK